METLCRFSTDEADTAFCVPITIVGIIDEDQEVERNHEDRKNRDNPEYQQR